MNARTLCMYFVIIPECDNIHSGYFTLIAMQSISERKGE
jgi:hypothetical protein